jgi:UDP-3-O-[3-hydroxymyristoyl] N-acetylglucosamine deacetylase/3-hydroxyacyl-[acyl-carrier-protein] dehydratase
VTTNDGKHQHTLAGECTFSGVGIHTGQRVSVTFSPAPPDHGLVFERTDLPGHPRIPVGPPSARYDHSAGRRTILQHGDAQVHTTEHVLAVLLGLGIDNALIRIDGLEAPEPPNGGTAAIVELLLGTGATAQDLPRRTMLLDRPVTYKNGSAEITAVPSETFRLSYTIDYDDPLIGSQHLSLDLTPDVFVSQIASARTFVLQRDVEALRAAGMIQGGTLENAIVVDDGAILNDEPLRFPDEFVRHKILDLCGDLALLGRPLAAHVIALRGGHASHVAFVQELDRIQRASHAPTSWVREPLTRFNKPRPRDPKEHGYVFDLPDILRIMPHRYPFLLVDRIIEMTPQRVVGIKNVSINEPFFQGHFPGQPIMPGVLLIEAMAQVGGVMLLNTVEDPEGKLVYFIGIDKARFRHAVTPGDQVTFVLEPKRLSGKITKMTGRAYVDGKLVAEAELMSSVVKP